MLCKSGTGRAELKRFKNTKAIFYGADESIPNQKDLLNKEYKPFGKVLYEVE